MIEIYTDGSAMPNPGKGGLAYIMFNNGIKHPPIYEGYRFTTNNRMELLACIKALEAIPDANENVAICTDSKYVIEPVVKGWLKDWMKQINPYRKNIDLWERFYKLIKKHQISFAWVKGHSLNKWNNECDRLAKMAANGSDLLVDTGYIKSLK